MNIGPIKLKKYPLFLAPMEDVTDLPFRLMVKRLGADVVVTEFASSEALIRDAGKAKIKIKVLDRERPVGVQIFGARAEAMAEAARIAETFKPDFIDINAGCSVGKHARRGECAGLLRDLPNFETIVKAVVKATKLPVTVKTRLGWDQDSIVILDVAKMVQDCGAAALTVHCRTKAQRYKGEADWSWLKKIRKIISIPLIGNGDIVTSQDAKHVFETGCDGVMIGRASRTNPWIFQQTRAFLKGKPIVQAPTLTERIELCIDHLKLFAKYKDISRGLYGFRKYYMGYLKGIAGVASLRNELMTLSDMHVIEKRLRSFLKERLK